MRFNSKIDGWYYVVIAATALTIFAVAVFAAINGAVNIPLLLGMVLVTLGVPIWLTFSTYYSVSATVLTVRSGPFAWTIPIDQIQSVQPSRSPLSSPALSLDRLKIVYGDRKTILVSPNDRAGFLRAIGMPE